MSLYNYQLGIKIIAIKYALHEGNPLYKIDMAWRFVGTSMPQCMLWHAWVLY